MPQSLCRILVHLVFSTKSREPFLRDKEIRQELEAYLAGTLRNCESPAIIVRCLPDHAHILCILSKNLAASKLVEEIKTSSFKWIKPRALWLQQFHWQNGYGAFSVSEGDLQRVQDYIAGQEEQHRERTFQEELRALLEECHVEWDERYVWD